MEIVEMDCKCSCCDKYKLNDYKKLSVRWNYSKNEDTKKHLYEAFTRILSDLNKDQMFDHGVKKSIKGYIGDDKKNFISSLYGACINRM